jgi:hypothetical protein
VGYNFHYAAIGSKQAQIHPFGRHPIFYVCQATPEGNLDIQTAAYLQGGLAKKNIFIHKGYLQIDGLNPHLAGKMAGVEMPGFDFPQGRYLFPADVPGIQASAVENTA